jgi:putative sigma-54 modulation protein
MKTDFQFVHLPVSEALETYTLQKLENLSRKYDWLIHATVFFKIDNADKEAGRICEVELSLNGPRIFATSNEKNFELAVKHTISSLQKQLVKRKNILYHH